MDLGASGLGLKKGRSKSLMRLNEIAAPRDMFSMENLRREAGELSRNISKRLTHKNLIQKILPANFSENRIGFEVQENFNQGEFKMLTRSETYNWSPALK